MKLKINLKYNIFIIFFLIQKLFSSDLWVNYGWEIFDYITDARSSALGNSTIAYNYKLPGSTLINPFSF